MTARFASLVCCFGLMASARAADAQTAKGSDPPVAATPAPAASVPAAAKSASVPAAAKSDDEPEKDELGRSKWWPAASANTSRPAPTTERDELGRSKWWPAAPAPRDIRQTEPAPEPPLLPFQRGILFVPYLGLSLPVGSNSGRYTTGHNFGAMIGIHLTRGFSLSTDINVDYMSPGPLATETQTDFTLGPLFQSSGARHFWVLGVKLGAFNITRSVGGAATNRYRETSETSYSNSGFVWGVTFGGFVPVGPVALGGLARITARYLSSNCDEDSENTICHDGGSTGISPALTTINLSAAALF